MAVRFKRLLQLKENNAKQFQNKSKTNPKQTQNKTIGFVSALRTCETKR